MPRIYVPVYEHPEGFASLNDLHETTGSSIRYYLERVVRFNLRYRDYARANGVSCAVDLLTSECPDLKQYPYALKDLKERLEFTPISDKNLFYWPKEGAFEWEGLTISLATLRQAVEIRASASSSRAGATVSKDYTPLAPGWHVAELWERVPCFDSSDYAYDNGCFENYFISKAEFNTQDIQHLQELKCGANACKLTEQIPVSAIPAVYFGGQSDFMIIGLPRS